MEYWQLRFLCRRIFMDFKDEQSVKLCKFDHKAQNDISIFDAAKKISAIAFINFIDENPQVIGFINPNADKKISMDVFYRCFNW